MRITGCGFDSTRGNDIFDIFISTLFNEANYDVKLCHSRRNASQEIENRVSSYCAKKYLLLKNYNYCTKKKDIIIYKLILNKIHLSLQTKSYNNSSFSKQYIYIFHKVSLALKALLEWF